MGHISFFAIPCGLKLPFAIQFAFRPTVLLMCIPFLWGHGAVSLAMQERASSLVRNSLANIVEREKSAAVMHPSQIQFLPARALKVCRRSLCVEKRIFDEAAKSKRLVRLAYNTTTPLTNRHSKLHFRPKAPIFNQKF